MSRKQKLRYLLAIYLVVAFIAIIIGIIAFRQNNDTWQSLLLNLSTELLGVVFVFLLVNVVFLIGDWDLSERVSELVLKLENPSARDFFKKTPSAHDLQKHIQNARKIDLCGVTLTVTLNRNFSNLRQRLLDGADIRIMIIYPNKETLNGATKRSESGSADYYRRRLEASLNDIDYLHKNWQDYQESDGDKVGNLAVGLLPYTPSFGMLGFDSGDGNRVVIVEMYPHHKGYDSPPNFYLTPEKDGIWYDYFTTQFEEMWNRTTPWQPGVDVFEQVTKTFNGG
jgi:prepilin signal peptidase PulO-like enzyme (type II secretory pathway)